MNGPNQTYPGNWVNSTRPQPRSANTMNPPNSAGNGMNGTTTPGRAGPLPTPPNNGLRFNPTSDTNR